MRDNYRRLRAGLPAVMSALALVVTATSPAAAAVPISSAPAIVDQSISVETLNSLQRDLGLTADQARHKLETDLVASQTEEQTYGLTLLAGPTASLSCEWLGFHSFCLLSYSSSLPVDIKWWINGIYHPGLDGATFASPGCDDGMTYSAQAIVTNAHGSATALGGGRCVFIGDPL